VQELREEAAEAAKARLKSWWELAPNAQETLNKAMTGDLRFPEAGPKLEPEMIRSAIRAAQEVLDRALGTPKQMHDHQVQGQSVVVHVAGPGLEAGSGVPYEPHERLEANVPALLPSR
jgi:hypothetical protein